MDTGPLISLLRGAAREVVEEIGKDLVKELAPVVIAEVRRLLAEDQPTVTVREFVSVKQAGEMVDAHPSTIRKLIDRGQLGRYLVGTELRVKVSELRAYLARAGQPGQTIDISERAKDIAARLK